MANKNKYRYKKRALKQAIRDQKQNKKKKERVSDEKQAI